MCSFYNNNCNIRIFEIFKTENQSLTSFVLRDRNYVSRAYLNNLAYFKHTCTSITFTLRFLDSDLNLLSQAKLFWRRFFIGKRFIWNIPMHRSFIKLFSRVYKCQQSKIYVACTINKTDDPRLATTFCDIPQSKRTHRACQYLKCLFLCLARRQNFRTTRIIDEKEIITITLLLVIVNNGQFNTSKIRCFNNCIFQERSLQVINVLSALRCFSDHHRHARLSAAVPLR